MNRMGLGLAVGAGYLLGRTKKLKMAVAVGGLVAGKKLNLSPRMVAELLQQQLRNNPQFKEIGDQLREDLRGVGKAASGAMVERQLDALSDRLHGRTAQMRDQLTGAVPGGREDDEADAEYEDEDEDEEPEEDEPEDSASHEDEEPEDEEPEDEESGPAAKKAPAKRPSAKKAAKKAPAKKAPAKKAAAKKAPAKKTAAKKTSAAKKTTSGSRGGGARSRLPKGGGEG
ncbi:DNA primase [Streptomyces sp. WAC04114]|uniref:DNA primase n=1 Tax=Streptomyces sp. WAC04114 TaxID=2867961 RepID=UPI001C8BC361|nr:DNA primase [Streptomyces sp. WAC04114]MBX9365366.1 DNA primase [Streptomyces sp. WAC04114]